MKTLLIALAALFICGCGTTRATRRMFGEDIRRTSRDTARVVTMLREHAVFVDGTGIPLRLSPRGAFQMGESEYERQLAELCDALRRITPRRVLIKVHGGLNGLPNSVKSAPAQLDSMRPGGHPTSSTCGHPKLRHLS